MTTAPSRSRKGALRTAAAAALGIGHPALAAEAGPGNAPVDLAFADVAADDAIVVTASRRRDEDVQDVPVAISVISADTLERRGDFTLGQIQQQVPSLQVFSFNPRNTNINIRGLGSNVALTNDGLENGVGFYIDNVYYGRVGLSQFDLVDLQGIEVLRGPQGTLFGKNTTAGVINITSKKPTFDPELSGEVTLGEHGFHQIRASASAGVVPDLLAVRLSGAVSGNSGFLYNRTTHARAQNYRNASLRGQLLLAPAPELEVRVIGDYARQEQDHVLAIFSHFHTAYANGAPIPNAFAERAARFPGYAPPPARPFDRVGEADSPYQSDMEGYGVSGEVNWDLGGAALTAITAYRWWDWNPANDGDSTALPIMTKAQQANRQRQFSQELRLASRGDRTVDYVIGAYYFWQRVRGEGEWAYGPAAALWNRPPGSALTQEQWQVALDGFQANSLSTPETRTFALFGQTDWHLSDAVTLTTGLRWTHEKKSGAFTQQWVAGQTPAAADLAAVTLIRGLFNPVADFSTGFTDNSLSGLVTLNWAVGRDANLYASYSRGNKSGGLNLANLPAGFTAEQARVRPEKVDAFEIGLKSRFLDQRATFNAAAFWTGIGDYQTAITEVVAGSVGTRQYIANIPKVRSRGVEGDLAVDLSDRLSFTASASYTDATYVDYANAPQAPENLNLGAIQDLSGKPLAGVPRFAWSIAADGNLPLGDLGGRAVQLYGHADYARRSSFNTSATNSAWAQVPGFGIANARIGLRTDDGLLDLSVWSRNLLNADYFLNLSAGNTGAVTAQIGEPRTVGVTLRTRL